MTKTTWWNKEVAGIVTGMLVAVAALCYAEQGDVGFDPPPEAFSKPGEPYGRRLAPGELYEGEGEPYDGPGHTATQATRTARRIPSRRGQRAAPTARLGAARATPRPAPVAVPASDRPRLPVTVTDVHDADTFTGTIHLPFNVDLPAKKIRIHGCDAWEVSRVRRGVVITEEELRKGRIARDALIALTKTGRVYVEETGTEGVYNRDSLRTWVLSKGEWIDVAEWVKTNGHERSDP